MVSGLFFCTKKVVGIVVNDDHYTLYGTAIDSLRLFPFVCYLLYTQLFGNQWLETRAGTTGSARRCGLGAPRSTTTTSLGRSQTSRQGWGRSLCKPWWWRKGGQEWLLALLFVFDFRSALLDKSLNLRDVTFPFISCVQVAYRGKKMSIDTLLVFQSHYCGREANVL